jgi:hypothetical protein
MSYRHGKGLNGYITASTLPYLPIPAGAAATTATILLSSVVSGNVTSDIGGNSTTVTKTGTVNVSSSVVPFSTSRNSFFATGASNNLRMTTNVANVGTGDFTVETFIYPTSYPSGNLIICDTLLTGQPGARSNSFLFGLNSTGKLLVFTVGINYMTSSASIALNTWTHVAFTRINGTCYTFINGTKDQTTAALSANNFSNGQINIGYIPDSPTSAAYTMNSYMNNWRFVKGIGLYRDSFTTPTSDLAIPTSYTSWTQNYGVQKQ